MCSVQDDAYSTRTAGNKVRLPSELDRTETAEAETSTVYSNPYRSLSIGQQRGKLPIFKYRNHILYLLERHQTVIVVGETGCGKSTQLPQYLYETGYCNEGYTVAVTQPRRVAAVTVANRCAEEVGCILGHTVGYTVRFDDCTSDSGTKIKFMTDGIMIREMMGDPLLTKYSVVMIDEAHERSVNTDLVCGLLRKIMQKRPDLKVIVSSATLDADVFLEFFNFNETDDRTKDTSAAITVEGRMHPVKVMYAKTPQPDYVSATVKTAIKIHSQEPPGDILAFLTGMDEVEAACSLLRDEAKKLPGKKVDKLMVVSLYGALPIRDQIRAFESSPAGTRKVVVATNIAEASITIPAIAFESEYVKLRASTVPEMQRAHMAPVLLQMKALGVENLLKFHYVSRPSSAAMISGLELLLALGAIDRSAHLTELGKKMAEFPLPPMHSKALLDSGSHGCSEEMLSIVAMLQVQDVFLFPPGSKHRAVRLGV